MTGMSGPQCLAYSNANQSTGARFLKFTSQIRSLSFAAGNSQTLHTAIWEPLKFLVGRFDSVDNDIMEYCPHDVHLITTDNLMSITPR